MDDLADHLRAKTASQWTDAELAEKLKNIPSKERQEAWIRAARKPYTEEERDAARAKLVALLGKMEEALKASGWLVGTAYSISDIAAAPFVKRIDEEIAPHEVAERNIPASTIGGLNCRRDRPMRAPNFGPFIDS